MKHVKQIRSQNNYLDKIMCTWIMKLKEAFTYFRKNILGVLKMKHKHETVKSFYAIFFE